MSIERVLPPPLGPEDEVYKEHIARYQFALPYVREMKVLDVACGTGFGSDHLSGAAKEMAGLDISTDAIAFAKQKYQKDNLRYFVGNADQLPFDDNSFDAVVSFETIEHLNNQERFVSEIARVLRREGLLIISTPDREIIPLFFVNPQEYQNPFHTRELSKQEFAELLGKKFQILEYYGQGQYSEDYNGGVRKRNILGFLKKFFTWLPSSFRSQLKSKFLGFGLSHEIFLLGRQKSKYLIAICRKL